VAVTSDGSKAYIADESGVISVIDTTTNIVSATIPVGARLLG
jgi:YVTN family beta-propeller protein